MLPKKRIECVKAKQARVLHWVDFLEKNKAPGGTWADAIRRDRGGATLPEELLKESAPVRDEVIYRVSYQGYLVREHRQVEKLSHIEKVRIPASFDYSAVRGLRRESSLKLTEFKPMTLGQASRISGVNPADISILMVLIGSGRGENES